MDKREKNRRSEFKELSKKLELTPDQVSFLLTQYGDEDCVIGIHNTWGIGHQAFFNTGLRNQTSMYEESNNLTNTVNYSDNLWTLLAYSNLNQKVPDNLSILLKIPKKVLEEKQGIFEKLPDGFHGIPTQFIVGAFGDGKVFKNENYDKNYYNENATKIEDGLPLHYFEKEKDTNLFIDEYNKSQYTFKDIIKRFIRKITGKDKEEMLLLNSGEENEKTNESVSYKNKAAEFRQKQYDSINENDIVKKYEEENRENNKGKDDENELGA